MSIYGLIFLIGFFGGIAISLCVAEIIGNKRPELALAWSVKKMKHKTKSDVIIVKD